MVYSPGGNNKQFEVGYVLGRRCCTVAYHGKALGLVELTTLRAYNRCTARLIPRSCPLPPSHSPHQLASCRAIPCPRCTLR